MVLLYALPLLLFAGTVTIKRSTLTSDLGLAAAIVAGMLGTYLVTFLIVRFALHRPLGVSALTALAVGGPAIPFAGVVVLGYLYGPSVSAVPVAVGALVFNVIEVPVTLVLLSVAAGSAAAASATTPRAATPVTQKPARRPGAGAEARVRCRRRRPETATAMQAQAAPASDAGPSRAAPAVARGEPGAARPLGGEATRRVGAGPRAGARHRRRPASACARQRDEAPGVVDHRRRIVRQRHRPVRPADHREPLRGRRRRQHGTSSSPLCCG